MVPQLWSAALTPSMTTSHPWSPPMTSTTIRINKKERSGHNSLSALSDLNSGDGLDRQDLAALVEPAGGTDPVWNVGGGALRAGAQLRQFQNAVIGPAHALTTAGWFTLGDTHNFLLQLQLVQFGPGRRRAAGDTGTTRWPGPVWG